MKRGRVAIVIACVLLATAVWSCGDDSAPVGDDGGGHSAVIDGNVVFPASWSGTWQTVLTFIDCTSDDVVAIEDVVDTICESDTLEFGLSGVLDGCDGFIDEDRIEAGCSYTYGVSDCAAMVSFILHLERDGDTVAGSGVWTVETTGACPLEYPQGCERVTITATRIDAAATPCGGGEVLSARSLAARSGLFLRRAGGAR